MSTCGLDVENVFNEGHLSKSFCVFLRHTIMNEDQNKIAQDLHFRHFSFYF